MKTALVALCASLLSIAGTVEFLHYNSAHNPIARATRAAEIDLARGAECVRLSQEDGELNYSYC